MDYVEELAKLVNQPHQNPDDVVLADFNMKEFQKNIARLGKWANAFKFPLAVVGDIIEFRNVTRSVSVYSALALGVVCKFI